MAEAQHAMTNGHCFRAEPCCGPGGEASESSRDLNVYISEKCQKSPSGPFKLNYNSMNFVD